MFGFSIPWILVDWGPITVTFVLLSWFLWRTRHKSPYGGISKAFSEISDNQKEILRRLDEIKSSKQSEK